MMHLTELLLLAGLAGRGVAQLPPKPEGVTVLKSKFHENVTISFKEVSYALEHTSTPYTEEHH